MKIITANIGSYPRIGETRDQQRLRRAYGQREKNEISAIAFRDVERSVIEEIIHEQAFSGVDQLTDGLVSWYDPISHIAGKLGGVKISGLLRFFDTNCYFRQPIITGKLKFKGAMTTEAYTHACSVSPKPVRAVLTGPYTLAKHSVIRTTAYRKFDKLVEDYAACLAREVKALSSLGAPLIQIDEPAILQYPQEFNLLKDALLEIRPHKEAKEASELSLHTYFGDSQKIYKKLQTLPVDVLGFDFTYSGQKLIDTIRAEGSDKPLGLGLVDGRNTRLESAPGLAGVLEGILRTLDVPQVYLTPSCGLEYLPRDKAQAKLALLGQIRSVLGFSKVSVPAPVLA